MVIAFLSLLLTWNLVVLVMYGVDKRKAIKGNWRISEKTLLLSALFLGRARCYDWWKTVSS